MDEGMPEPASILRQFHSRVVPGLMLGLSLSLAACGGGGGSATVPTVLGTHAPAATSAPTNSPTTQATATPSAAPTARPSSAATTTPTVAPTALPTSTAAPTATPGTNSLTGTWIWGAISGVAQQQGSLPNVALTNVSSGFVIITTDATGQEVTISGSTCPSAWISNSVDAYTPNIEFPVSRATLSCQFTITDDLGTGKSVTVYYTNT